MNFSFDFDSDSSLAVYVGKVLLNITWFTM